MELEQENQAYTFIDGRFVERMMPDEIQSVEKALATPIEGIREHFATALRMLSDREHPDHRNSVKESISAVEAACKHLTGLQNATLGQALNQLHSTRPLHPAFKDALSKLYGWTNQEDGVRHAIMESDKIERADAQFMLVTCSAFVNYLFERGPPGKTRSLRKFVLVKWNLFPQQRHNMLFELWYWFLSRHAQLICAFYAFAYTFLRA